MKLRELLLSDDLTGKALLNFTYVFIVGLALFKD